jgi:DNA-binding response OmpR family regulator
MQTFVSPRLLLIDDDDSFSTEFSEYLGMHGFSVARLALLDNLVAQLGAFQPHVIVLDQFLAALDTLTILGDVRARFGGGIVMLTGNQEQQDRVVGLELGADDFINKTQPPREILARLRAVLRRVVVGAGAGAESEDDDRASAAPPVAALPGPPVWDLNTQRRELLAPDGSPVRLTSMEFELLAYLAARSCETVSRDELSMAVLRRSFSPFDRSLDNLVARIRIALRPFLGGLMPIKSIRGVGYVFVGFLGAP